MKPAIYKIGKKPFLDWYSSHKEYDCISIEGFLNLDEGANEARQLDILFEKKGRVIDISKLELTHDWVGNIPNSGEGAYDEYLQYYYADEDEKVPILLKLYSTRVWEYSLRHGAMRYIIGDDYITSEDKTIIAHFNTKADEIVLPQGVVTISNYAAQNLNNLRVLICPDSVREIGDGAFMDCESLSSIHLPNHMRRIGAMAFEWCDLESIRLPEGITSLFSATFKNCLSLHEINIPSTLERIEFAALGDAVKDKEVILPEGFKFLDHNSLRGVARVYIPSAATSIDSAFYFEECVDVDVKRPFVTVHPDNPEYYSDERGVMYKRGSTKPYLLTC